MEKFYEIDGLAAKLNKQSVLKAMECYEDSPVYEEVMQEYDEIHEEMLALAEPVGILGVGTMPKEIATKAYKEGTPIIYAVISIGDGIKQCSTRGFQEGDYVKGMLCDAIADEALFSLEGRMMEKLQEVCSEHHVGILKRLEAPHDISMESQRKAWEYLELQKRFGIDISSGYMFDPVKTSCQVFILTEDETVFKAQHDCRKCPNVNCKMRNIPDTEVTVKKGEESRKIVVKGTESLMSALIREGYYISAPCGGKGRCGKCGIRVLDGEVLITPEDEKAFSKEELEQGWRLSCEVYPMEELTVSFELGDESQFEILSEHQNENNGEISEESGYDIAVDIGTTTIAMELIGRDSKRSLHTVTAINGQRAYGADVISRIQASIDGKKEELQASIRKDLQNGIQRLVKEAGIPAQKVGRVSIGGNTTMGHLLMGYDCDTLGVFPFTPVNIDFIKGSYEEIIGSSELSAEVILLPGISTYVGGDIVSGLYACGFDKTDEICLLVDLGTNGEMALGNKDKILVTSTAAGPAFEGGNITWGMGSVPGAICSVKIEGDKPEIMTIQDKAPVGICGTGVVETVAELVKEELVEVTGLMDDDYFDDGYPLAETEDGREIVFTQDDVREIQLAKAAVRAGMETLVVCYGIDKSQVKKVYLAGGFGYKLDKNKAVEIGMFPEEFRDRIETVGNSSLAGAMEYLGDACSEERIGRLTAVSEEINLSSDKFFNECYMNSMLFGEE